MSERASGRNLVSALLFSAAFVALALKQGKAKGSPISQENAAAESPGKKPRDHEPRQEVFAQADQKGWSPEEKHHHRVERRYWCFTAVLTGIAALGAVATVVLSTMSVKEARKATAEAHRQADIAQDAERAWIAPVQFSLADLNDTQEPLKVRITYQNVGHEPARRLRNSWSLWYVVKPSMPAADWNNLPVWKDKRFEQSKLCEGIETRNMTSVAYPSPTFGFSITARRLDDANYPASMIPVLFAAVKAQEAVLIVAGCFSYETINNTRFSTFCAFLDPAAGGKDITQWGFSACPVGNDDFSK